MRLELLLLVAGAVAAPELSLPPLGLLSQAEEGAPPRISCFAPRRYAGSTFELVAVGDSVPTQSVTAEPGQHSVDFTLDGSISRCYRCRYRSYNGSAWQMSAFSTELVVNASGDSGCHPPTAAPTGHLLPTSATLRQDRSWLVPVAVSASSLVLLLLVAAAVAAWRVETGRQRAKRQQTSCWTETRCPTTEFSYDNCGYGAGVNALPGSGGSTGTSPASPQRDPPVSPPAVPHFSTFRSLA